ncbi:hypothetical protein BDV96DRAFT_313376 [Lophiotrema nucula]|uniref:Cora-like Mg2+ transporter protein-domain-containing protein n=1 Tax=Lophiotrema nucula TaxID=690887 RepID=A0A6A5ZJS7_9PLEO|nr:hypothetical protein BDV96DRAFT_313376 [Lophiotrema nucula]
MFASDERRVVHSYTLCCDMAPTINYMRKLADECETNERYVWLHDYFRKDTTFLASCVHPLRQGNINDGSTVIIIAHFYNDSSVFWSFPRDAHLASLESVLERPPTAQGLLVFVTSVSGVSDRKRKAQLTSSPKTRYSGSPGDAPVLTWSRTAGVAATHPIEGHASILPDPEALEKVANHLDPKCDLVLQYLDQNAHLNFKGRGRPKVSNARAKLSMRYNTAFQVMVDQANHVTVALEMERADAPWTMLMLAAEDNCLGIDFSEKASVLRQPLRPSTETPSEAFKRELGALTESDCEVIRGYPLELVSLYANPLISAFAAHIELYQRNWSASYEPYANTSVVYGYAYHRDAVRQLAKRYSIHLRYLKHTLDCLKRQDPPAKTMLDNLVGDFEHFEREIGSLKANCDQFLEQQVSKLALQDARASMREAKDLKRLSYMAFIFVPLSLTSSFFGMNVKELDAGSTPLWVFIVTSVAILLASIFLVAVTGSEKVTASFKKLSAGHIFKQRIGNEQPELGPQSTAPFISTTSAKKRTWPWRFWQRKKPQSDPYDISLNVAALPPTLYGNPAPNQVSIGPPLPATQPQFMDPSLPPGIGARNTGYANREKFSGRDDPVIRPEYADPLLYGRGTIE